MDKEVVLVTGDNRGLSKAMAEGLARQAPCCAARGLTLHVVLLHHTVPGHEAVKLPAYARQLGSHRSVLGQGILMASIPVSGRRTHS